MRETLTRVRFHVYKEADGSGFYAAGVANGRTVWRSLTTKDEAKAERWKHQAHCHGTTAHHLSCHYCKEGDASE